MLATLAGWLAVLLLSMSGGRLVQPTQSVDGREVFRIPIAVEAPAGESLTVEGASVLTWNRAGRIFFAQTLDAEAFVRLSGHPARLAGGQSIVFSDRQVHWAADEASHTAYVFRVTPEVGPARRLVYWCRFAGAGDDPPLPVAGGPSVEIRTFPDRLQAVRMPRSGRLLWGFELWLQETGGEGVDLTRVQWTARAADGSVVGERTIEAADLAPPGEARPPRCGPDGVLRLPAQRLEVAPEVLAVELAVAVQGTSELGRPVTSLARFDLRPADDTPALTACALPVRGEWRVALGPGDPPHLGRRRQSWVFDRVDRQGRAWDDDGARLRQHHAYGQTVYAPAAGDVVAAVEVYADAATPVGGGRFSGAGGENHLLIRHAGGEYSYLGGLLRDSIEVLPRSRVEAGQPVAKVGCNGTPLDRPALVFRLMREPRGAPDGDTVAARFSRFTWIGPQGREVIDSGAPETGDRIEVR